MLVLKTTTVMLAVVVGGCCLTAPAPVKVRMVVGTFEGEELAELRAGMQTDEERCEAACLILAAHFSDAVQSCEAIGSGSGDGDGDGDGESDGIEDLPTWDPAQVSVEVTCWMEYTDPQCT